MLPALPLFTVLCQPGQCLQNRIQNTKPKSQTPCNPELRTQHMNPHHLVNTKWNTVLWTHRRDHSCKHKPYWMWGVYCVVCVVGIRHKQLSVLYNRSLQHSLAAAIRLCQCLLWWTCLIGSHNIPFLDFIHVKTSSFIFSGLFVSYYISIPQFIHPSSYCT